MKRIIVFVTFAVLLLAFCQVAFARTSPAGFDAITANEIKSSQFARSPFNVSKNSEGTILLYKTNRGRYGKLLIRKYLPYKKTLTVLTVDFTTYGSNGRVYRKGRKVNVSYQGCDFDSGKKTSGKNTDFKCVVNLVMPANGALLALYKNPTFAIQGIKRKLIYSNRIQFAVQYYIPTTYRNPCMITARRLSENTKSIFLTTIYGVYKPLLTQHNVVGILKSLFSDSLLGSEAREICRPDPVSSTYLPEEEHLFDRSRVCLRGNIILPTMFISISFITVHAPIIRKR